jgi:hypothetical protein
MARITTYATLATAVQAAMGNRTDIGVASGNLDQLCSEAEEEMNARLRVRRMLTTATPTVSSAGVVTLPSDWLGYKRFVARDGSSEWDLDLREAQAKPTISSAYLTAGKPQALITGSTTVIWPYTDLAYTYTSVYYAMIPQLTSSATSNWVLANFPNAYLYGCLAAARGLVHDDEPTWQSRLDRWEKRFSAAINRIQAHDAHDLDARTHVEMSPDTALFSGSRFSSNITGDGA